jgi:MFS transporter, DHA2 family, multidrug resistance protein
MVIVAPRSAKLVEAHGSRFTLLFGYLFCLLGFLTMLLLWGEGTGYWAIGLGYALLGIGVGLAGTPASRALTGSVPVRRAGMASATADLQRDFGGAMMQSILVALLTAGYASAMGDAIAGAPASAQAVLTDDVESQLQKSFAGAEQVAERYPAYQDQIIEAARQSFLQGDRWAYAAGIVAVLIGAVLVWHAFPGRDGERAELARYTAEDRAATGDGGTESGAGTR